MSTSLLRMLDAEPGPVSEPSDEDYIRSALAEFRRGNQSRGEFRQQSSVAPEKALTAGELRALERIGLGPNAEVPAQAERARQQALHVFFHAYQTALPTIEVATMLGVNASRIRQRVKERTLLAMVDAGEIRFPSMQFHDGRELPGLRELLPTLPPNIKTLEALSWFATPSVELAQDGGEPQAPRDYLLATGEVSPVIELARMLDRGETA